MTKKPKKKMGYFNLKLADELVYMEKTKISVSTEITPGVWRKVEYVQLASVERATYWRKAIGKVAKEILRNRPNVAKAKS